MFTGLTEIPGNASSYSSGSFINCSSLSSILIPNTVKKIGGAAFAYCSALNIDLDFPSVEEIGKIAFTNSGIKSIVNLGKVESLEGLNSNIIGSWRNYGVFSECSNLTSAILPTTLKVIGDYCFMQCPNLTIVVFLDRNSITTIKQFVFYNTPISSDVDFPYLETIGYASYYNTAITSVKNLGKITTLGRISGGTDSGVEGWQYYGTFRCCKNLTSVNLPTETIKEVGQGSFANCTALEQINLASCSVLQMVCEQAFYNCGLMTVDISTLNNLKKIADSSFYKCTALTGKLNAPSLESIGDRAFARSGLKKVSNLGTITTFPLNTGANDGVWGLGVFGYCTQLELARIPDTVTTLPRYLFYGCTALATIIMDASTPPTIESGTFSNTNDAFLIYVPDESLTAYREATNWITYADRIKPISEML